MPASVLTDDDKELMRLRVHSLELLLDERTTLFKTLLHERDVKYGIAFKNVEDAYKVALVALEARTHQSFECSKEAVEKAENAQLAYNLRSNEFRASLDDQAKLLLTRTEADARLQALDEKSDAHRATLDSKIETVKKDIYDLREFRSNYKGVDQGENALRQKGYQVVIMACTLVSLGWMVLGGIILFLVKVYHN